MSGKPESLIDRHPRGPGDTLAHAEERQPLPDVPWHPAVDQHLFQSPAAARSQRMNAVPRAAVADRDDVPLHQGERETRAIGRPLEHPGLDGAAGDPHPDGDLRDLQLSRNLESISEIRDSLPRRRRMAQDQPVSGRLPAPAAAAVAGRAPAPGELAQQLPARRLAGRVGGAGLAVEPGEDERGRRRRGGPRRPRVRPRSRPRPAPRRAARSRRGRAPGRPSAGPAPPAARAGPAAPDRPSSDAGSSRWRTRLRGTLEARLVGSSTAASPAAATASRSRRAREREQRPRDRAVDRADAGQPLQAAAEEEPEQHGLGLVVAVMGGGDPARAEGLPHPFEKLVARPPAGRLGGSPAPPAACARRGRRSAAR